jgi:hypothetical protein
MQRVQVLMPERSVRCTAGRWPWPLEAGECRLRWCIGFPGSAAALDAWRAS